MKASLHVSMTTIRCKRPSQLQPKAIGGMQVFNFFGPVGWLAAISGQGLVYLAHETPQGVSLRTSEGATMDKGPVHRFIAQHLSALKEGAVPASLTSVNVRLRPPKMP